MVNNAGGTIETLGGSLQITAGTIDNAGGTILASGGNVQISNGATISAGTVTIGTLAAGGTSILSISNGRPPSAAWSFPL